jgi:hypothetical protein
MKDQSWFRKVREGTEYAGVRVTIKVAEEVAAGAALPGSFHSTTSTPLRARPPRLRQAELVLEQLAGHNHLG